MSEVYIVFDIHNCTKDYVDVFQYIEYIEKIKECGEKKFSEQVNSKIKVHVYCNTEGKNESREKLLARFSSKNMQTIENCEMDYNQELRYCLRIAHDKNDSTVAYLYLSALLYQYREMFCFLFYSNDDEGEKYAVWDKATEFFFGLGKENAFWVVDRIYGEYKQQSENVWFITKFKEREHERKHTRVYPLIEFDVGEKLNFWRKPVNAYKKDNIIVNKILKKCQSNFIEECDGKSLKRQKYYESIYFSDDFQKEIEGMPLFAFYLFCIQMYYLKGKKEKSIEYIRKIRLKAWDIADGILQLMENVCHSAKRVGFLSIRVHQNIEGKQYLDEHYGIDSKKYNYYYEIRLLDLSDVNITESFRKKVANDERLEKMTVSDFFSKSNNRKIEEFWNSYGKKKENLVHHYGLQIFSSIVAANEGIFKVISSSKYFYNSQSESYSNKENINNRQNSHIPGTEYDIVIPIKEQEEQILTSVENNIGYQYEMDKTYKVISYVPKEIVYESVSENESYQKEKENIIDSLARKITSEIEKKQLNTKESFDCMVVAISTKEMLNYSLEIYCKAIILSGMQYKEKTGQSLYCMIHECKDNQVLEMVRIFAIFYMKSGIAECLSDMQIYLAGERAELLIYGNSLNDLYGIVSKIMLVRGVQQETMTIIEYLLRQYNYKGDGFELQKNPKLIPFDILKIDSSKPTIFEKNVKKVLESDIQKYTLGCKVNNVHMRIGSKLHIGNFFEAELLFHNNYYVVRFAKLLLEHFRCDKEKQTVFVGYETYSELLLYKIVIELKNQGYDATYMVYEEKTHGKFRYMEESILLNSKKKKQFVIIIPINSTLTTHNKVRSALVEEMKNKRFKESIEIVANYALILVRSVCQDEMDEMEQVFWEKIDVDKKKVISKLLPVKENMVYYFVSVDTKWYSPHKCPLCFPKEYDQEKPLIDTNKESIVPRQMLGLMEESILVSDQIEKQKIKVKNDNNLERIERLSDSLVYRHIVRNGNHYIFYFSLEKYFITERESIIEWLKSIKEKQRGNEEKEDRIIYNIIVAPLHYSNAGFLAEVNYYLFDNAALVLHFEVEKEFRDNVKTKYSNIIGLYHNLEKMGKKALIRFHFVDDTIVSAKTFFRARSLFQSLISPTDTIQIEVFANVVVLLNRMSLGSIKNLIGKTEEFYAYVNLNISSMRNHEDACTECKLVEKFIHIRDYASTNQQYKIWSEKISHHVVWEIENESTTQNLMDSCEKRRRAHKRMICTHRFNECLDNMGYKKNNMQEVRQVMIELMEEKREDYLEWIISYIKIFSRPFVNFRKSNREAIFQIMLWLIKYLTERLPFHKKSIPRECSEIREICKRIKEMSPSQDEIIYGLIQILMKRLSDLGSNYVIRKENILTIIKAIDKLSISEKEKKDFRIKYISTIKQICCQSGNESKSVFLEYLLLFGEEYRLMGKIPKEKYNTELGFCISKDEKWFSQVLFMENTKIIFDGIVDLSKDFQKLQNVDRDVDVKLQDILKEYYYDNLKKILSFYGYLVYKNEDEIEFDIKESGQIQLLVWLYDYLRKDYRKNLEVDAEEYYRKLLQLIGDLRGCHRCYLLYKTDLQEENEKQFYRICPDGGIESLKTGEEEINDDCFVANTYYIALNCREEDGKKIQKVLLKYVVAINNEEERNCICGKGSNTEGQEESVYLQIEFDEKIGIGGILLNLKFLMCFYNMLSKHLKNDFSNNMIQKWSAKEYFNKQVLLERATDHTDRDNLLKYYNIIMGLHEIKDNITLEQRERDRALFHMVINSYIARMNIQILAGANPEREPSKALFISVYRKQLDMLLKSLHVVENFKIFDENGEECFSNSLLEGNVKIRQTKDGESLSVRRICIIITELILSAISHSGEKDKVTNIYIYREENYLVVKNRFINNKGIEKIKQDIRDSIARKKDGISLATIQETVNACYGLTRDKGVIIEAKLEDKTKYFYVKLPILYVRNDKE